MGFFLETERLRLKLVTPKQIHELFETRSKPEIMELMGLDEAEFGHWKQRHEKGMETNRISLLFFLLANKSTGKIIGECGFHTWNDSHKRAEIFYAMKNDTDKGKGFMTEALGKVLEFGFSEMELNRVEAFVSAKNEPSVRLLKKFRFTKEGTARGHYRTGDHFEDSDYYALLASEFGQRKM